MNNNKIILSKNQYIEKVTDIIMGKIPTSNMNIYHFLVETLKIGLFSWNNDIIELVEKYLGKDIIEEIDKYMYE